MTAIRAMIFPVLFVAVLTLATDALAQYMSNRCFTAQFVCLIPQFAPPGTSCYCSTPYGPVPGVVR
jgi:hypothetical protein